MVDRISIPPTESGPEAPEKPQEGQAVDRPEWLPENFKTPEDLAKSYQELQAEYTKLKQGGQQPPAEEQPKEPEVEKPAEEPKADEARKEVENRGLDFDAYAQEFAEQGQLGEDSYKALQEAGIPKEMVDAYIQGQTAVANSQAEAVFSVAGGKDQYNQMVQWAAQNLTQEQIAAYDSAMDSDSQQQRLLAATGLYSQFQAANGKEPSLVGGKSAGNSVDAYQSWAEVTAAMKDARYNKDPAFREQVQRKLAVSKL